MTAMGEVERLRAGFISYRDLVAAYAATLDRWNVFPVPDGDTGTNLARTMDAVVAELEHTDERLEALCLAVSRGSLLGARGNSGVILSQILRGMTGVLAQSGRVDAQAIADGLRQAADAAYQAVMKPVEGTMLTVAREAAAAAERAASRGASVVGVLDEAHRAGREALERTPELLPALKAAGVVDAGGAGFVLLFDALLHVLDGRPLPQPSDAPEATSVPAVPAAAPEERDGPRYEVMFLLDAADDAVPAFKDRWAALGDSIVVVGGEGRWSCHVHTDDVGAAIEAALEVGGRPHRITVMDLHEQVAAEHEVRLAAQHEAAGLELATSAVVAVASGSGLAKHFATRGAHVVRGGQTANPSTAELLEAVAAAAAGEVLVLPNNGNVVPVANQLPVASARLVTVVPTRSMPEGLAALDAFRPDRSAAENAIVMQAAASAVTTGEVTRAVRDAETPAGRVRVGDALGLVEGEGIVVVAATVLDASTALLARLLAAPAEQLTLVTGVDADEATTDALVHWLLANAPGVALEVIDGGQPHYPYLFGVERPT